MKIKENRLKNGNPKFDVSMLKEASQNKPVFFNRMLTTFVNNTKRLKKDLEASVADTDWKRAGELVHKSIPSFKYFGLVNTVNDMKELEDITLHKLKYENADTLTEKILKAIENIIQMAEDAKMVEDNRG